MRIALDSQQRLFMINCLLSMVIKLLRSEQLNDGISGFVKAEQNSKMNHDLTDLLPKQQMKVSSRFVS